LRCAEALEQEYDGHNAVTEQNQDHGAQELGEQLASESFAIHQLRCHVLCPPKQ